MKVYLVQCYMGSPSDGPAVEYVDGTKYWYLNEEEYTEKEFNAKMNPTCNGKVVEIDGVKYKLTKV